MNFSTEEDKLRARYRLGTEQALEQAEFVNNPDLVVLQALTIHLSVLQNLGETRPAWIPAGVLVRMAVSMKLHSDGTHQPNLGLFEMEMRRRLWWQICLIDARSEDSQISGYKISEEMFDTTVPANVDDMNLYPEMLNPPTVVERWTDMTVFLIRCEIWKLSHRLQTASPPDIESKLALFQQSQAVIEDTHLDQIQPLHCFVAASTRLFLSKVDLILHAKHCSSGTTARRSADYSSYLNKVFTSSLSIIEYTYSLQNEPKWSVWHWQIQGREPPWHALRFVLTHLCTHSWEASYERVWSMVGETLGSIPETVRRDPRYQRLMELASAVESKQDHATIHQRDLALSMDPNSDLMSARAMEALRVSTPRAQDSISRLVCTSTLQESVVQRDGRFE